MSVEIKKKSIKNNLGQFFTTNKSLQQKLYEFILNKPKLILILIIIEIMNWKLKIKCKHRKFITKIGIILL